MIYLRLAIGLVIGLLFLACMALLVVWLVIFAPKTFDEIFKRPID